MPSPRRGAGAVLIIVAAILTLLGVFAFGLGFQSRGMTMQSGRANEEEQCEAYAQMALAEAAHYIRVRVNEPGTGIFDLFRKDAPTSLWIPPDQLAFVGRELKLLKGYSLGSGISVNVLRRAPVAIEAEERVPYEAVGVVRLSVAVDGPDRSGSDRTEEFGFRSVLTAPPRPFDLCTFFMLRPDELLTRGAVNGDPNGTIKYAVDTLKEYKRICTEIRDKLRDAISQAGPYADGIRDLADIFDRLVTRDWPAEPWEALPPDQNTLDVPAKVHLFDWPICVLSVAPQLDLGKLNLPEVVGPRIRSVQTRNPRIQQASEAMNRAIQGQDLEGTKAQAEVLTELIKEDCTDLQAVLVAYKTFQDLLIEVGGEAREDLEKRVRRISAPEQSWRAHYRFEGEGAAAQASAFLARDPPPSGVVYVDDPAAPLTVRVSGLSGRLAIVSKGNMVVQRATVADTESDALVLIAYGDLEVEGELQAGIISWNGGYRPTGNSFTGSLILDTVVSTSPLDLIFKGTLTRQTSLLSGPDGDPERPPPDQSALHVALDPAPPYRRSLP